MNENNETQQTTDPAVSQAASALGKRARGVPKRFTAEELERRKTMMQSLNEQRAAAGKVAVAKGVVKRVARASGTRRSV